MQEPDSHTFRALRRQTAPGLLCKLAHERAAGPAFRYKRDGTYHTRTWAEHAGAVSRCAAAFKKLGLQPGERVAIIGDPCEPWVVSDMAAQAIGCISYGIYPTVSAQELAYQLRDGGAALFVAETRAHVEKLLQVIADLPELRTVVVLDRAALPDDRHGRTFHVYSELIAPEVADLEWLTDQAARLDPESPAFIIYTSGTTGAPKGAVIGHGKHLASTWGIVVHYPVMAEPEQRTVVFLPFCHVLGRDIAITLPMLSGIVPYYGESLADFPQTLLEVVPNIFFIVPRYLQKFASQILVEAGKQGAVRRALYELAMRSARRTALARWKPGYAGDGVFYRLGRLLAFQPLLRKFGFHQLRLVVSGGAPLARETGHLWQAWGVNVVEMYGQTETAGGIIAGQKGPFPEPGNVGTLTQGWRLHFSDAGEVLIESPDLFDFYWNNEAATRKAYTPEGWLRTGDIGEQVDGNLHLLDRARDFIVTSGGKTISPAYVENVFKASRYISEIIVTGHSRKYLVALVELDLETTREWALAHGLSTLGYADLAKHPLVAQLIEAEIAQGNEQLARVEQIKKFRILPAPFNPEEEGALVTPTRKVKRSMVFDQYKGLIATMYDDEEERRVAAALGGR